VPTIISNYKERVLKRVLERVLERLLKRVLERVLEIPISQGPELSNV
jgi:hypothetical protein